MTAIFAQLPWLIFIAGVLHFGLLLASGLTPQVLDWRKALRPLDRLLQQVVWVHGAFIVLVIIGFGILSLVYPRELAAGTPLARGLCGFIALFWAARLGVQFFVFDAKSHLGNLVLKVGYHALTLVFTYFALVYAAAALA
jgi:hypothetical protein